LQWPSGGFCLSALKVICPKCARAQEVADEIPAGGTDHVCVYCRTVFKVRPPTSRLTDDLPAAREAVPRPGDLPVSRDAIPRPGDLPVSRDAIPRPGDLPISRDAIPRPDDLLQSKGKARPGLLLGPERSSSKTPPLGLALEVSLAPHSPAA